MKKFFIIDGDVNLFSGLLAKLSINKFKAMGYESDSVKDVVSKLLIARPDYVILDLALPNLDGFELLEKIKTDDFLDTLSIFVFTSLDDNDSKDKARRLGVEFYYSKNEFSLDEFVNKVLKIISNLEKMSGRK